MYLHLHFNLLSRGVSFEEGSNSNEGHSRVRKERLIIKSVANTCRDQEERHG